MFVCGLYYGTIFFNQKNPKAFDARLKFLESETEQKWLILNAEYLQPSF